MEPQELCALSDATAVCIFLSVCWGCVIMAGQTLPVPISEPTAKSGQLSTPTVKSVRPVTHINGARITFRELAKFAWPQKTEQFLSFLTGYDARTCRRWLADQTSPPADALGVVLCEIMKRYHGGQ